jgi:hypothetical protein
MEPLLEEPPAEKSHRFRKKNIIHIPRSSTARSAQRKVVAWVQSQN